ncbi:MAG: class I SAM-dependent methyltransferase [Desulfobacca sp.]|nr:class I SAM-dependent methyltransferase [Desulfobacca sp.]
MPIDYRKDKRYAHLTPEQVRQHFEAEKILSQTILKAEIRERSKTAVWAYDELFRRIPWHPALTEKSGPEALETITAKVKTFLPLLPCPPARILEVGCGMGELSYGLARENFECLGIDISEIRIQRLGEITTALLHFARSDATYLPFVDASFDVVISMQLFEHLHPDDAVEHLREVYRILRPGGRYLLETPNKLIGPGDVSRFFVDGEAQGFHLKEYRITELLSMLKNYGFGRIDIVLRKKKILSGRLVSILERLWGLLPKHLRSTRTMGLHNPIYLAYKK